MDDAEKPSAKGNSEIKSQIEILMNNGEYMIGHTGSILCLNGTLLGSFDNLLFLQSCQTCQDRQHLIFYFLKKTSLSLRVMEDISYTC